MVGGRRRSRTLCSALALAIGLSVLPGVGHGQAPDPDRELPAAQHDLDEAIGAEAALLADYRESAARVARLDRELAVLDVRVTEATRQLEVAEAAVVAADREAEVAEVRAVAAEATLRASIRRLQGQAVEAYIAGPPSSLTVTFLSVESTREAQTSLVYARAVLDEHRTVVEETRKRGAEAVRLRRAAQRAVAGANEARDALALQELELTKMRVELATTQAAAREEASRKKALADQAATTRRAYAQRVAALKAESERLARELREQQAKAKAAAEAKAKSAGQPPRSAKAPSRLADPLDRMVITSRFGPRKHPVFGDTRFHYGIDLDGDTGDRVMAAAKGTVLSAGTRGGYGLAVVVDHGGGLATLYAHLSTIAVKGGQSLAVGHVVGRLGSTGTSTGPHLHFEVRVDGTPVDPEQYLP